MVFNITLLDCLIKAYGRIYDNSPTDNWPTRQLSDSNFSPTTNSPTRPLDDKTSHRHFFKKLTDTCRHSPTLTDRAFIFFKYFFSRSILLYFQKRTHTPRTLLSIPKRMVSPGLLTTFDIPTYVIMLTS